MSTNLPSSLYHLNESFLELVLISKAKSFQSLHFGSLLAGTFQYFHSGEKPIKTIKGVGSMNMYSVVPNPKATGWLVKLEDVAPENQYDSEEEAIEAAEKLAKKNRPSTVQILNMEHDIVDEKSFR